MPAPKSTGSGKPSGKRRKSGEDPPPPQKTSSGLLRSSAENKAKEKEAGLGGAQAASLPPQRAPSIFTFDSSSIQPHHHHHHHKSLVAVTSASSSSSSSSGHDGNKATSTATTSSSAALTHSGSTLDDLCRAAAELERMDTSVGATSSTAASGGNGEGGRNEDGEGEGNDHEDVDELGRRRPGNISIPRTRSSPSPAIERDRHRLGATPPYTPPPILSPSRSLIHLALGVGQVNNSSPCTPNRIMQHWSSRKVSETEEGSFSEPRINIGEEFQAKLPDFTGT